MEKEESIFGCFFKVGFDSNRTAQEFQNVANVFRVYIWGEKGIYNTLEELKQEDYGRDLELALFEFQVKPTPEEMQHLKEIESYRKKEKSIGIPIIINDENFFDKSEEDRYRYLKESIIKKMDLLEEVVKRRKLDTNMVKLKADLEKILK